ncbi:MAG: hypothetical protein WBA74_04690, partial [Cyclobacteriaceae bacterium]
YENGDSVHFENAEFLEFLAAKEILKKFNNPQKIHDLIYNKDWNCFHNSWYNTISYIALIDVAFLILLIDFICKKEIDQHEEILGFVLPQEGENLKSLGSINRSNIFDKIFKYYQETRTFINFYVSRSLADYITIRDLIKLEELKIDKDELLFSNVLTLIKDYSKKGEIEKANHSFWIEKFDTDFLLKHDHLRNYAELLTHFRDKIRLVKLLSRSWIKNDLFFFIVESIQSLDPNSESTIQLIFKARQKGSSYDAPRFDAITSREGIIHFLKYVIKSRQEISSYSLYDIRNEVLEYVEKVAENIERNYDHEIAKLIKLVIFNHPWYESYGVFYNLISKILVKYEPESVVEYVKLKGGDTTKYNYHFLREYSSFEYASEILDHLISNDLQDIAVGVFYNVLLTENPDKIKIDALAKQKLQINYKQIENNNQEIEKKNNASSLAAYNKFMLKIEPKQGEYMTDVFRYYHAWRKIIKPLVTDDNKAKIESLIYARFNTFNRGKYKIRREGNQFYYPGIMQEIDDSFHLIDDFNIDLSSYRNTMLKMLPYSHSFRPRDILGNLTNSEIKYLKDFYEKQDFDFWKIKLTSFLDVVKRTKSPYLVGILKELLLSEKIFDDYNTKDILRCLGMYKNESSFIKSFMDKSNNLKTKLLCAQLLVNTKEYGDKMDEWMFNYYQKNVGKINYEWDPTLITINKQVNRLTGKKWKHQFNVLFKKGLGLLKEGRISSGEDCLSTYRNFILNNLHLFSEKEVNKIFELASSASREIENYGGRRVLISFENEIKESYLKIGEKITLKKVHSYLTKLECTDEAKVYNAEDLKDLVLNAFDIEIVPWAKDSHKLLNKDLYSITKKDSQSKSPKRENETLIQKTIVPQQIYNTLLSNGFNNTDIVMSSESRLLNDNRIDFQISCGLVGKVLLEIKLSDNQELQSKNSIKNYKDKFLQYVDRTHSDFGIIAIFQVSKKNIKEPIVENLRKEYADCSNIYFKWVPLPDS